MKENELDHLLKSVRVPERTDEYWNEFPKEVTAALRRQAPARVRPESGSWLNLKLLSGWGPGLATVCIIAGLAFGFWRGRESTSNARELVAVRKYYGEIKALFPNQVRAIIFDKQGARLILAEKADVPSSPPFYVKICGPKGCESIITFSGQAVPFNGDNFEVLADAQGEVMLVGKNGVWAGGKHSGPIRFQAKPLEATL